MSNPEAKPLTYAVRTRRMDALGSEASCKEARLTLDTGIAGRSDAFNPAELLLAALSACMIKGIERVAPLIKFEYRGVEVRLAGVRQDAPPKMARIDYEILVDTRRARAQARAAARERAQLRNRLQHGGAGNRAQRDAASAGTQ